MEENQAEVKHELDIEPDIVKDDLNTPLVKEKLKSNVRALRNSVIACYHISCGIFFGVMTYFAISLILSTFFSELSVMFGTGANAISLGFSSFVGFIFYAFIIGIALIISFVTTFWNELIMPFILLPAVVVGLAFMLYGQFKYNKGLF